MSEKLTITAEEAERYTGISGLDAAEWGRTIFNGTNGIRVFFSMVGWLPATGLLMGVITAGFGVLGAFAVFVSLGIPVAQAKAKVAMESFEHGFAIGVVIALLGFGKYFLSDFVNSTQGSGGSFKYMAGIHQSAYNTGLVLGYSAAIKLTDKEKSDFQDVLEGVLTEQGEDAGMHNWTDKDRVLLYANAFLSS